MAAVLQEADADGLDELEPEFFATDRILKRWWSANGSGLPNPDVDPPTYSKPPPLNDDCAAVMDKIIASSPRRTYRFIRLWYTTPKPRRWIARELNMGERSVGKAWCVVVMYIQYRIQASKHPELNRLLAVRV